MSEILEKQKKVWGVVSSHRTDGLTSTELFKKFKIVRYTKKDLDRVNNCIEEISSVLSKYDSVYNGK